MNKTHMFLHGIGPKVSSSKLTSALQIGQEHHDTKGLQKEAIMDD